MSKSDEKIESKENEEEAEANIKADDLTEQQQLFYFARRGDIEGVKNIAKSASVDINGVDDEKLNEDSYITKNTALHYAVASGKLQCVKVLYNLEAKLDATNKLKSTPLHLAASLGYTEIVKYLISVKANIEAKNIVQNTPLHCAVYAGHVDTVQVILSNIDEPRQALLEPNGVGMGAAKYTAHDDMKSLLRTYFPKKNTNNDNDNDNDENKNDYNDDNNNNDDNNDVEEEQEEEAPPAYHDDDNDDDNNNETAHNPTEYNPTDDGDGDGGNEQEKEPLNDNENETETNYED